MTAWPWLRSIPWYRKVYRVFHCMFSMMAPVVYLNYLAEDLERIFEGMKND